MGAVKWVSEITTPANIEGDIEMESWVEVQYFITGSFKGKIKSKVRHNKSSNKLGLSCTKLNSSWC